MLPLLNGDAEAQRVEVLPEPHSRSVMLQFPWRARGRGGASLWELGDNTVFLPLPRLPRTLRPSHLSFPRLPVWVSECSAGVRHTLLPQGPRAPGVVVTDLLMYLSAPPL